MAIFSGVAGPAQATAFLGLLDERYAALAAERNLSSTAIWSVPCSLFPLDTKLDSAIPTADPPGFPIYESGGSFFREVGYEALGRAVGGQADRAHEAYTRFMDYGFSQNRGWQVPRADLHPLFLPIPGSNPFNLTHVIISAGRSSSIGIQAHLSAATRSTMRSWPSGAGCVARLACARCCQASRRPTRQQP